MNKKSFFELVKENYYKEQTISLKDFNIMLCSIMPVFGQLKVQINNNKEEIILKFIDEDKADIVFNNKNSDLTKEDLDMSSLLLTITTNKDGIIQLIEHGLGMFTTANKDIILYLGSLIGKKIEIEKSDIYGN